MSCINTHQSLPCEFCGINGEDKKRKPTSTDVPNPNIGRHNTKSVLPPSIVINVNRKEDTILLVSTSVYMAQQSLVGQGLLIIQLSLSHSEIPQPV